MKKCWGFYTFCLYILFFFFSFPSEYIFFFVEYFLFRIFIVNREKKNNKMFTLRSYIMLKCYAITQLRPQLTPIHSYYVVLHTIQLHMIILFLSIRL